MLSLVTKKNFYITVAMHMYIHTYMYHAYCTRKLHSTVQYTQINYMWIINYKNSSHLSQICKFVNSVFLRVATAVQQYAYLTSVYV